MINTPLHRVTVKPFNVDEWDVDRKRAKELGFALPDSEQFARAKASVDMGTVVQIGPTAFPQYDQPEDVCPVQVGATVAYVKNSGKSIKDPFDSEEYLVLNDEDIVMVFTKE